MTREEAIGRVLTIQNRLSFALSEAEGREIAENDVDCYAALGMLKLDEPKTHEQKLSDFMQDFGVTPSLVKNALKATGLKIVEA